MVQGQGPGPRYGHVMDLVAQRYLVTVSGNDGETNLILGCPFSNFCNKTVVNILVVENKTRYEA